MLLTEFKITDATELEDSERRIPFGLFENTKYRPNLEDVLLLVDALRRRTLDSESTVERDVHDIIASGIGFLKHKEST